MVLPEDSACIVTISITLDIASNHGVIVASKSGFPDEKYDLLFLHFGTSSEVLDHLSGTGSGLVGRRHMCSIPATIVNSFRFMLQDRHCLWEISLVGCTERVIVYCGLHGNGGGWLGC
ncbi:Bifunctional fucokinase/fucose pyrophosphorylase [Abeliophyllum distichum]|uniref:Bifunctional fucokinase/fucose pyrophosphorylase n=1 Tax=Abeliophyllum distichum TaxID=126358 RepID=A0ABD1TX84_9LAMI